MDKTREEVLKDMQKELEELMAKYDKKFSEIQEARDDEDRMLGWFPPLCPNCGNILSHKLASGDTLACIVCVKEFKMNEFDVEREMRRKMRKKGNNEEQKRKEISKK
jgi:hypothetical protein